VGSLRSETIPVNGDVTLVKNSIQYTKMNKLISKIVNYVKSKNTLIILVFIFCITTIIYRVTLVQIKKNLQFDIPPTISIPKNLGISSSSMTGYYELPTLLCIWLLIFFIVEFFTCKIIYLYSSSQQNMESE